MKSKNIIWYSSKLKIFARQLRKNSTKAEVFVWIKIKGKALGYEFHRQVPLNEFIVDFYCHELKLAIELDGNIHNYKHHKDTLRQKKLESLGVRIVRFTNDDVFFHLNDVLRALEIIISEIESGTES